MASYICSGTGGEAAAFTFFTHHTAACYASTRLALSIITRYAATHLGIQNAYLAVSQIALIHHVQHNVKDAGGMVPPQHARGTVVGIHACKGRRARLPQ